MTSPARRTSMLATAGASALPAYGRGKTLNPGTADFGGLAGVTPIGFQSSFPGTLKQLRDTLATDPASLARYDDANRIEDEFLRAAETGHVLAIGSPIYTNQSKVLTLGGRNVAIIGMGNAALVGGPDCAAAIIKFQNSGTMGQTAARSVPLYIEGVLFDCSHMQRGTLNSRDCLDMTGLDGFDINRCRFYAGADYRIGNSGGDAGIFCAARGIVRHSTFRGFPDLCVYISGSFDGQKDNQSFILFENRYIKSANAVAWKRNARNIRAIGDYIEGCYNGYSGLQANGNGDGVLSGSRATIIAPHFHNMISRCIDPRSSDNWLVEGMLVTGTYGVDLDGGIVANVAPVVLSGSRRCRVTGVIDVVSTDPSHAALRIQSNVGNIPTENAVSLTVKGIANGVIETVGDNNEIDMILDADVATPATIAGANTRVSFRQNGVSSLFVGPYDRLPGRTPFSRQVFTTSISISLIARNRIVRFRPDDSNINAILPLANARAGDRIGVTKVAGGGAGFVQVRDPTNSVSLIRLREVGDLVWMVFDGTDWRVDSATLASNDRMVIDGTIITADATASGVQVGRITPVRPGPGPLKLLMTPGGANGAVMGFTKVTGSGAGVVTLRDVDDMVTLATLSNVGDIAFLLCTAPGVWTVIGQHNAGTAAAAGSTAFGRSLLSLADAPALRAAAGLNRPPQIAVPVNGGTTPIDPRTEETVEVYFNHASPVTGQTIAFPMPFDGQRFLLMFAEAMSGITMTAPTGTLLGAFASNAANARAGWVYRAAPGKWFRYT